MTIVVSELRFKELQEVLGMTAELSSDAVIAEAVVRLKDWNTRKEQDRNWLGGRKDEDEPR